MNDALSLSSGRTNGFWEIGMLIYALIVIVANLKILIVSSIHNTISLTGVFGSILVYFATFYAGSNLKLDYYSYGLSKM